MTDALDPRRATNPEASEAEDAPDARTDAARDLHGPMSAEAAAIGGSASGFPAAAIANPDLLTKDDPAEGPRDDAYDGGADESTDPRGR